MSEKELDSGDILKGLTNKAFNMDYIAAKECLYIYLRELVQQIKHRSIRLRFFLRVLKYHIITYKSVAIISYNEEKFKR